MRAFPFFFDTEIKDHVLVNNWENGWLLRAPEGRKIVIVFWPQYLEYVGFALIILTFMGILLYRGKKKKRAVAGE